MTSLANNVVNNDNQKSAESFQEEWGNDLSENMIVLANLYDKQDFKELKIICETQIKNSLKKLKSKKTGSGAHFEAEEIPLAYAFLARAYLGLYQYEEAQNAADEVEKIATKKDQKSTPMNDFRVLRLLKEVLVALHQSNKVTSLYANAYTATKGEVSQLGDELFLAYGRSCDFMSQQKLAMKMYRKFKFPKYAIWAATAIMLQLSDDPSEASKQKILLMTAERLISKVAADLKDKGQASELYINVLEDQKK
jgi:hypothetical protein